MYALLATALTVAAANPCRSAGIDDEERAARIAAATEAVREHEGGLDLWFGAVFGVHAAVMATTLVIGNITDDDGVKKEMWVAAFGSGLGIITLFTGRPPIIDADDALADTEGDARLATLEALLEKTAGKIDFSHSWISHGASFLYSAAASLVLWLAFDRPRAAVTQFLGGQLIGQGRLLLQPTGARSAWDAYRSQYLKGCGEPVEEATALRVEPAGFGLRVSF